MQTTQVMCDTREEKKPTDLDMKKHVVQCGPVYQVKESVFFCV